MENRLRNGAHLCDCNRLQNRINTTLYGQPDSLVFGSAVDFREIDTKGFNFTEEGAFVHAKFTGGCQAVVFITFE